MRYYITIFILFSLILPQDDRSTLFSTGNPPVLGEGWNIACSEYSSSTAGDINQDGNIGIGTNNPSKKLEVRGDGLFHGSLLTYLNNSKNESVWNLDGGLHLTNFSSNKSFTSFFFSKNRSSQLSNVLS